MEGKLFLFLLSPGLGDCRAKQQLFHTGNSLEVPWGCGCTWGGALSLLMEGAHTPPLLVGMLPSQLFVAPGPFQVWHLTPKVHLWFGGVFSKTDFLGILKVPALVHLRAGL